jgi:hypothetical protein
MGRIRLPKGQTPDDTAAGQRIQATATLHNREMNRTERKYADHLRERLMIGEIRWWEYEAWKFRLADNTYYTPDFIVVTNDMRIEAHEVKAYWPGRDGKLGKTGWTDDARVKIKVAAEEHPVRFIAVTLMPDQQWHIEQFQKDTEETPALETESRQQELRQIADALHMPDGMVNVDGIVRAIAELDAAAHTTSRGM